MRLVDFDYELPPERIAQQPIEPRDASRLLVLHRETGAIAHRTFGDLPSYLRPGDLLVVNDTRVLPARLHGEKAGTRGRVEVLLLREIGPTVWEAMVKPGRRLQVGALIEFPGSLRARIAARSDGGGRVLEFSAPDRVRERLLAAGKVPLPPYIHRRLEHPERYQTVYARAEGSSAAPTAGLHFTPEMLALLRRQGMEFATVTLHIGLDTFRPIKVEVVEEHQMHTEHYSVSAAAAEAINQARAARRRVIAVGTTTARALESAADEAGRVHPGAGTTALFIRPGYRFRTLDGLLTNFHLPKSTLLLMVSAFAGREHLLAAYREALREGYRFLSFGDVMLII